MKGPKDAEEVTTSSARVEAQKIVSGTALVFVVPYGARGNCMQVGQLFLRYTIDRYDRM